MHMKHCAIGTYTILCTMYESLQALEELRGEILGSETVVTPERNPLDFATVATQTDDLPAMVSDGRSEDGRGE